MAAEENLGKKSGCMRLLRKPRAPPIIPQAEPPPSPPKPFYLEDVPYPSYFEESCISPVPSGAPSLASGALSEIPPRSRGLHAEFLATPPAHKKPSRMKFRHKESALVLDPMYRDRTNVGTFVEGHSLVKPYKSRGPDPLPPRPPRRQIDLYHDMLYDEDMMRYYQPPEFTLQDFLISISSHHQIKLEKVKRIVFSVHNYKKIQKLLADSFLQPGHAVLTKIDMNAETEPNIPKVEPRIPQQQLLIEMAALLKEQVAGITNSDIKSCVRPLPKYNPNKVIGTSGPHTEIVLYEDSASKSKIDRKDYLNTPSQDAVFHANRSRYFQGSKRSSSPFAGHDEGVISPSELAVLDSLVSGGTALSLKAHFIAQLPDICPLLQTITYLNLSFNDLRIIPAEIFEISQLSVLKLRNNPITEIPHQIGQLACLRTFVISFCLVSSLPLSLYSLDKLEHLDLSYNRIVYIPNDINNLRMLKELNVEGNQLGALPCGALRFQELTHLRVRNNYMHPLFWKENMTQQPQRLLDLAALSVTKSELLQYYSDVPDNLYNILSNMLVCDCCHGPLYGPGFRIIRPVSKIFGIKNLPFLFAACTPHCAYDFMNHRGTLSEIIYDSDENKV